MEEKEHLMRIGEIAAFFNVSAKAIRLYEKKGILVPEKIDPATGYRYYTADQVQVLNALIELKSYGFSLCEIKAIVKGETDSEQLRGALLRKRAAWQDAISQAENKIAAIDRTAQRITESKEAAGLAGMTDEQRAWLLVKMVCVEDLRVQSLLSEAIWL